jgi:hypothetical protein
LRAIVEMDGLGLAWAFDETVFTVVFAAEATLAAIQAVRLSL